MITYRKRDKVVISNQSIPENKKENMDELKKFYSELDNSSFDCHSIADIKAMIQSLCNDDNKENISTLDFEWRIFHINKSFRHTKNIDTSTEYGLSWMTSGTQTLEDGTVIPVYWPDVAKLEKKDFEYCEKRYNECKNLFAKVEYGLMVYFGQQTDFSKRNDFKKQLSNDLFNLAKDYYAKTIQGGERNHYVLDFYRILELSFIMAKKAKLNDEIDNLIQYIYDIHQNWDITKDGTLRVLLDLSCLMSDYFKIFKDKVDLNKVIDKNIAGAKELEKTNLWGAIYAIDKNIVLEQQLGLSKENSLRYKAEIYEQMMNEAEGKNNNLAAVTFTEDALRLYQSLKDQDKIRELNEKYGRLRGEITLTEHHLELPKEHTEHISKTIQETIEKSDNIEILKHFILTPWYSSIADVQKNADNISNQGLIANLLPVSILDKYGNTIDVFRTDDEIKEHNFWESYSFNRQIGTQTMHQFFIEAYKAKKISYESTIDYLEVTWLNEPIIRNYNSNKVEIKPLDTIRPALKKIFEELELSFADGSHHFDYVTITDSLTLKIESILRNFCEKIGIPTFKTRQKGADKLVMEKLIDDLFADLKHSTENPTNFDEEDRQFIRYVLTEKSGLNLRNKVAHGLMDLNEYSFSNIILLFSIIMKLSKYTFSSIA